MAVNLKKGQKVDLRKSSGGELKKVMVGLGWDPVEQKRGWFGMGAQDIDCDASVFLCQDGRLVDEKDIVAFFNLKHKSKSVRHTGDNLTGEGEGDDEEIIIDLQSVPPEYDKAIVVVNIYQAKERKQHFGLIKNAFIRIVDMDNGEELLRYDLSGDAYDGMTAMVFGEVYRHNGKWKFGAVGQATTDNSISELAARFR
ncbi:MAG: TerD family protein [Clostridia bacterium]|nr:TerD family protein [Clostridia bacterium]